MPTGTYIGWLGQGNMGDEAMWWACRQRFPGIYWTPCDRSDPRPGQFLARATHDRAYLLHTLGHELTTFTRSRRAAEMVVRKLGEFALGEVGMLGGGTLINERNRGNIDAYTTVRRRTGRPVPVFGTGVSSPDFWRLQNMGWQDHRRDWVEAFRELAVVGVRGPLSKQWLDEAGATNVIVSGDSAVLFHAGFEGRRAANQRDTRKTKHIGINCGDSGGLMWGGSAVVHEELAALARKLVREGHAVELFAVWPEDLPSCERVAQAAGFDRDCIAPVLSTHDTFLQRVIRYDMVVALKLHAGILAAAANVPFVQLEYRPKCLDFCLSIGWDRFSVRTDEVDADRLLTLVQDATGALPSLRNELCEKMCALAARFEDYCLRIEPLLTGRRRHVTEAAATG